MQTVDIFRYALRLHLAWDEPRKMEIYFDGKLQIEGRSTAFTNGVIEAGVIHCRALLEFLGLQLQKGSMNRFKQRAGRRDDVGIEDYGLDLITVEQAVSKYTGSTDEAEAALATTIRTANKFIAHNTMSLPVDPEQAHYLEIASRGVPALVVSCFYTPLKLAAPDYKLP